MTNPLNCLTRTEREILNHRLEIPDALAECLPEYHEDDVGEVADLLRLGDYAGACEINKAIAHAVLADAVEGGTWNANINEEPPRKQSAKLRATSSLARKISEIIGRPLRYPAH